jgi:NADP-dependent 3-hydroxy acid dehydrogenase YdfG
MISEPLRNPLALFDVKDKVAIITGASGTFGRATALTLTSLGAKVLLASGSKSELDGVEAEVRELGGDPATIVRRPDSLEDAKAMLDAALAKFGRVDQLVVASGLNKPGFIHEQALEDWQSVMDANVRGIWLMAKVVGTYWIENKVHGKVVVMSSVRGRHGNFSGYTGYCASKGATDSLTRVLATEIRHHRQRHRADRVPLQAHRLDVRRQRTRPGDQGALTLAHPARPARRGRGSDRHGFISAVARLRFLHRPGDVCRRRLYCRVTSQRRADPC